MRIAIVGPCVSGTTTLANNLRRLGYDAHAVAQEHSYVPDMWRRLTRPDVLVYLDASMETIRRRRPVDWGEERLAEERARLAHARAHCDLYIPTDSLSPEEVLQTVLRFLEGPGRQRVLGKAS